MRGIRSRGQALVLFAMLMLILVLAAIATMSLAHLTQQKMEMQVANDTAAYSQAVAAARTYNSVALLNRAQVATMVALQGIHSAISFAGTYRGSINAAMYAYQDDFNKEFGKCTQWNYEFNFGNGLDANSRNTCEIIDRIYDERSCERAHPFNLNLIFININIPFLCSGEACDARKEVMGEWGFLSLDCNMRLGGSGGRVPLLKDEWCRVKNIWDALDDPTGEQGRDAQAEAVALGDLEHTALTALPGGLAPLATKSVGVIGAQANVSVGVGEVARSYAGGGSYNGVEAALGSRAHPFISQRADGRRAIEEQLRRVVAPSGAAPDEIIVEADFKGSSFFDQPSTTANRYSYSHGMREPQAYASWADEHGRVSVSYEGPRQNLRTPGVANRRHRRAFKGSQSATDEQHEGDTHEWCPADLNAESRDPYLRHTLLPHKMPPPNEYDPCQNTSCIWPGFYDANATLIVSPGDVFGQPKLFTVASKDLAGEKNPWNLIAPFRFARNGSGQRVDFTAKHALKGSGVVPDFQAMSAGMAYYHRPGHWKEHPNFFNPYWRATLVRYKDLNDRLEALVVRVNAKFAGARVPPVKLLRAHHEPPAVFRALRAADLCYVSSLHDGMNLVAKEFVAARDDEQGVLVLSSFTGAARELTEALVVNPYDLDEAADALRTALEMKRSEQKGRMHAMRAQVKEFNVYRWAGRMLIDVVRERRHARFSPLKLVHTTKQAA